MKVRNFVFVSFPYLTLTQLWTSYFPLWDSNQVDSSPHLLTSRKWDTLPLCLLQIFWGLLSFCHFQLLVCPQWFCSGSPGLSCPGLTSVSGLHDPEMQHSPVFCFPPSPKHNFIDCLNWSWHCTDVNKLQLSYRYLYCKSPTIQNSLPIPFLCGYSPPATAHPDTHTSLLSHFCFSVSHASSQISPSMFSSSHFIIQNQFMCTYNWLWVSLRVSKDSLKF